MRLNPKCFGLACGTAAATFYLGCVLLMTVASPHALVIFFNSLLHGVDIELILKPEIGWLLSICGLINTFIFAWLLGALIAAVYNLAKSLEVTGES